MAKNGRAGGLRGDGEYARNSYSVKVQQVVELAANNFFDL
jgi:hypothetical protein